MRMMRLEGGPFGGAEGDWLWGSYSWLRVSAGDGSIDELRVSPGDAGSGELYVLADESDDSLVYRYHVAVPDTVDALLGVSDDVW